MHNNTNNSDRMNTVAYKIGQAIALVVCLCVSSIVKTQRNMNARDTGINIKSARMKTHMNVSTLSRRRNSNKRFPARKIHPLL